MSKATDTQTAARIKDALDKGDIPKGMVVLRDACQDPAVLDGLIKHIQDNR